MNDITLTSAGKDILYRNTLNGGQTYWVGYYGLAYVPDQSKFDANHNELIYHAEANGGSDSSDGESGDYIYNIWQSDLVNAGHSISSNSLTRLTLYDRNLAANFRYIYDSEKGCNRLVTWTTDGNAIGLAGGETPSYIRTGYKVYDGVQMGEGNDVSVSGESNIPCPAPLFYLGHGKSYTAGMTAEEFVDEIGSDWPLNAEVLESDGQPVPLVTPDMRYYFGTVARPEGSEFGAIPPTADSDPFGVIAATETRGSEDEYIDQFAEFVSISNFNKAHGHVSSEGYGIDAQESCHNMSRVTKLFPIAQYEIDAREPSTKDSNVTEKGSLSQIKYIIDLDLRGARQSMQDYFATLEYQSKNDTDERESEAELESEEIFSGNSVNSFKFNRIGIYAVPATIRHFYKQGDAENGKDCRATHYQVEISPDADPILFAVIRLDEVSMSEDASFGMDRFRTEFAIHLEAEADSGICKDPQVYYNLVENEAITWYQNQLLATAGLSEAVTNLGVNVAYLLNKSSGSSSECIGTSDIKDGSEYAPKDHTHDYMRNLVDGTVYPGAVRGVNTKEESAAAGVGENSLQLGENTGAFGPRQIVQGINTTVDASSYHTVALGASNTEVTRSVNSAFLGTSYYGASEGTVDKKATAVDVNSTIVGGAFEKLEQVNQSLIIGSYAEDYSTSSVGTPACVNIGPTTASIALGNMASLGLKNSILLRGGENPISYMYNVGIIQDSVVLGQGYGDYDRTDIADLVGEDVWNSRQVADSLVVSMNRSSCLTDSDYTYIQWLGDETDANQEQILADRVVPNVFTSVITSGTGDLMRGTIATSLISSRGYSKFNRVLPQYINDTDEIFGYGADDSTFGFNLALTSGSDIPTGTQNSVIIGGGMSSPVKGKYNLWIGDGCGNNGTDAKLMTADEFNELAQSGNLTQGNYVLLSTPGDHPTIKVGSEFVELKGEYGYHAGVVVDSNLSVSYTPYVDRIVTIYGNRGTNTGGGDTIGTVTRKGVSGTNIGALESGYGCQSQHWAAKHDISKTLILGASNKIGSGSDNCIIVGSGNSGDNVTMENCILIGSGVFNGIYSVDSKANEVNSDGSARNHLLRNVTVLSQPSSYTINSLFATGDMSTTDYKDALIFLNSGYCIPEVLGIFPVPTCYSAYSPMDGDGPSAQNDVTVNRAESYFEYDPNDFDPNGKYQATGGIGSIFTGKTKSEIKAMINKPNASMIYTGGICLAGKPYGIRGDVGDDGASMPGLLKLGSIAVPSDYITTHPLDTWVDNIATDPIIPKIVTGTTVCPYGGRVLGVLDTQEPDGTLQLGLFPNYTQYSMLKDNLVFNGANDTIVGYKFDGVNTVPFGSSGSGLTTTFTYVSLTITDSSTMVETDYYSYKVNTTVNDDSSVTKSIEFYPRKGCSYEIKSSAGVPTTSNLYLLIDEHMDMGDEFYIAASAYPYSGGGNLGNQVPGNSGINVLGRKVSYITNTSGTAETYGTYLLLSST